MPYVALRGPSPVPMPAAVGLGSCGCSAPRLPARMAIAPAAPISLWPASAGVAGLGFDLESFGAGSGAVIAGIALLIGGLLLFGPGARQRSSKLKEETSRHREAITDENRRHKEEIRSIKGTYTRLPRAVTYGEDA